MNLQNGLDLVTGAALHASRALRHLLPRETISAFGAGSDRIERIVAINLERQPKRWQRLIRELGIYRSHDGKRLSDLTDRLPAVDARDGRETAPTADVDPIYPMADQLFVQPDARLLNSFGPDERIRMTRQEIAVARSHVEAWKRIARGAYEYTLVLEDDVHFTNEAGRGIDRAWRAIERDAQGLPQFDLLYLSYLDADGTAERAEVQPALFRPVRGLWYLSGYVLSRRGARRLLQSMPVVGPVDLWMNRRFGSLDVLALSRSALLQRSDGGSDNAYSILPYLSRAGIVDAGPKPLDASPPQRAIVFAWNSARSTDAMGMALSSLGYRVRTFSKDAAPMNVQATLSEEPLFDAFVDAKLDASALQALALRVPFAKFVFGARSSDEPASLQRGLVLQSASSETVAVVATEDDGNPWDPLCGLLDLPVPNHAFPKGASHDVAVFQLDREVEKRAVPNLTLYDTSPWILPIDDAAPSPVSENLTASRHPGNTIVHADLVAPPSAFRALQETFPGNMALFDRDSVTYTTEGAALSLTRARDSIRPLRSGALASLDVFEYGCFEAEIRAARGAGLVTGFFLHRELPRQEIDIEILGADPGRMLVNVYFNPGDEGTALGYGYRGTPQFVDLGFDASADFHRYAIEWTPAAIRWFVDDRLVHQRLRWNPTPIPHLPMRLYANLWSPRSIELAGELSDTALPAVSMIRQTFVRDVSAGRHLAPIVLQSAARDHVADLPTPTDAQRSSLETAVGYDVENEPTFEER